MPTTGSFEDVKLSDYQGKWLVLFVSPLSVSLGAAYDRSCPGFAADLGMPARLSLKFYPMVCPGHIACSRCDHHLMCGALEQDFTFVCPTEILAFNKALPEFAALNTEVLGVSCDSEFSHLAWSNVSFSKDHQNLLSSLFADSLSIALLPAAPTQVRRSRPRPQAVSARRQEP